LPEVRDSESRPPEQIVARDPPHSLLGREDLLHREGTWWEVLVRQVPPEPGRLRDVWLDCLVSKVTPEQRIATYGAPLFAYSKSPLTRAELRRARKRRPRC
jgi:hypothetical protein